MDVSSKKAKMKNQKRIDVEKFSRMWWKYEDGKLTAKQDISRDPFGDFEITFTMTAQNGAVDMEIRNRAYPTLSRTPVNYESFPAAVEAVAEYFEGIDEHAKKVPQNVKEQAKRASQDIIAREIAKITREVI